MRLEEREVRLKDGRVCTIRSPGREEAGQMLALLRLAAGETEYLARYPDEIGMGEEEEAAFLAAAQADARAVMAAAWVEGRLAASAGIHPVAPMERFGHRGECGITVLQRFWGLGIGTALLRALCGAAGQMGYEQLELEVAAANRRASALYQGLGFVPYGRRPRTFKYRDGRYADACLMVLAL